MRVILLLAAGFFLSACQTDNRSLWEQKYRPSDGRIDYMPYSGNTSCYIGGPDWSPFADIKSHIADGYSALGLSVIGTRNNNLGSPESIDALKAFGQKLGADTITYGIADESVTGVTTSGSVSRSGNFSGTTVMNVGRIWTAIYYRKIMPEILEMRFGSLSAEEAKKVGTYSGVKVWAVIRGGPAYRADIFEGDVVTEVDGEKVSGKSDFVDKYVKKRGAKIVLTIIRDGVTLKKVVQLNP